MGARVHRSGEDPLHDPEEGPNSSLSITWTGTGDAKRIDYIEKTIGGRTWRKTFSYDVDYDITAVSTWVEQ